MKRSRIQVARQVAGMIPASRMDVRLYGTGARPDGSRGFYVLDEIRRSGKVVVLGTGETPYQAITAAGLWRRWPGEIPRPSWGVIHIRRSI